MPGLALRLSLIAAALLFVFGSLLRSADPIFASLVSLPEALHRDHRSHVVLMGFCAWIAGGSYGALVESPSLRRAPDRFPITLGCTGPDHRARHPHRAVRCVRAHAAGMVLRRRAFLRATTGLTAAQYARQGFFQMVWVVTLVVPLRLATRAMIAPDPSLARRHTLMALPLRRHL